MSKKKVIFIYLTVLVLGTILVYQKVFHSWAHGRRFDKFAEKHHFQISTVDTNQLVPPSTSLHSNGTFNIPELYLRFDAPRPSKFNDTCAFFPKLFDMKIRNDFWQVQETSNGTFHLFNAYLDDRNGSVVRILGTYDQYNVTEKFWCQLWYEGGDAPLVVPSGTPLWLFRSGWGADRGALDHPYLITCPLVDHQRVPFSVSLAENFCDNATNNLKIVSRKVREEKKNFVVCVKGLSFPEEDKSARLAEWIELLGILGAEKINFYEFSVHPGTKKVLEYYVEQGKIEVSPITLVGDVSNRPLLQNLYLHKQVTQRRLQEVIPYNDCLYKHLEEFKYVVLLDTDEVVVPVNETWVELIETLENLRPNSSSYLARNVYFLDSHLHEHDWFEDIPHYMHILQHVYRARNYTKSGYFVKGFHDTSRVLALHNHYPLDCFDGCRNFEMDVDLAQLQHYRADCVSGVGNCDSMKNDSVLDPRVWRFKKELMQRVIKGFQDLNYFKRD